MLVGIKSKVSCNNTANLHAILDCDNKLLHKFLGNIVACSTQHKAYMTTIHTILVYFETDWFITLCLGIAAEWLAERNIIVKKFNNLRVFCLAHLKREGYIFGIAPLIAQCWPQLHHLTGIGNTITVTCYNKWCLRLRCCRIITFIE